MITDISIEPIDGRAFDVVLIEAYLREMPFTVQDRVSPTCVFMVTDSYEALDEAVAAREKDPTAFPTLAILIDVSTKSIGIAYRAARAAEVEPARRFVEWLRRRYELRFMDEAFTDLTSHCVDDLDFLFGPPRVVIARSASTVARRRVEPPAMVAVDRFPIGCTLNGGAFEIVAQVCGTPDRGLYLGRERESDRNVLVTLGPPQEVDVKERHAQLAMRVKKIARLRFIGRLESKVEAQYAGLVEDEPDGAPASELLHLPVDPPRATQLAIELARIVEDASAHDAYLVGLRPELVYLNGDGDGDGDGDAITITGVAPRCEPFLVTAQQRMYGVPPCFEHWYLAPEVLARPREPATELADVFSICAMLAHWVTGEHPFEGHGTDQVISIAINRRRQWSGPSALGAIVDAGLAPSPTTRPSAIELMGELDRLA